MAIPCFNFFIHFTFLFLHVCLYKCLCIEGGACGVGVLGSYELSNVGLGLWRNRKCSELLSHVSSPDRYAVPWKVRHCLQDWAWLLWGLLGDPLSILQSISPQNAMEIEPKSG